MIEGSLQFLCNCLNEHLHVVYLFMWISLNICSNFLVGVALGAIALQGLRVV